MVNAIPGTRGIIAPMMILSCNRFRLVSIQSIASKVTNRLAKMFVIIFENLYFFSANKRSCSKIPMPNVKRESRALPPNK